jgi:DNA polymerase III epsilon subunit-like protein
MTQQPYRQFQFGSKVMQTTDEQYKIITADVRKNILVLACAGSGKSTTMVCRVKYLIEHGINPKRIMLTTFNVDACESLRQKLKQLFGDIPEVFIGTLDSISCRMYHKYCKQDHFVGVSEYAICFQKFLESNEGQRVTSQFDVVIFDEFQDINEIQFKIIKSFYDRDVSITVIGDDAQNIYQWRGSDVKYILNADTYFPKIGKFILSLNYRSSTEVIDFAGAIISHNKDQIQKPMVSKMGSTTATPIIQYYYSINQQSKDIIKDISLLIATGVKPDDIAVISRTNYPIKNAEEELTKHNKFGLVSIRFVSLITDNSCDTKPKITEGCVTLTTIHKAKGLEWDYVYFVSCDDETIPSNLDAVSIQEERRLFYVATTRAKRYLKISFTKKTVSRFISEIPSKLYTFIRFSPEYFRYTNRRSHLPTTELDKLVMAIQESDIDNMRSSGLLPPLKPQMSKHHDSHKYTSIIEDNYLHSDFNNFVAKYIIRTIGLLQKNESCCSDIYANILCNSITVTREVYNSYSKYAGQIFSALPRMTSFTTDDDIIRTIGDIAPDDKQNIVNVVRRMMAVRDATNGKTDPLVVPKNYIPSEFMQKLNEHYDRFKSFDVSNADLIKYIYTVSLCKNICDSRRRLMYNDMFKVFSENATELFEDANEYIAQTVHTKLKCNTFLRSALNVDTLIEMYDPDQQKIIDIHSSSENACKLEWIIEALGQVSIMRECKFTVTQFEIYNPMQGCTYSFDVSKWTMDKDLLNKLDEVRSTRETRNAPINMKTIQKEEIIIQTVDNKTKVQQLVVPKNDVLFDDMSAINNMLLNIPIVQTRQIAPVITQSVANNKEPVDNTSKLIEELNELISRFDAIYNKQITLMAEMNKIKDDMDVCDMEVDSVLEMKANNHHKPYYVVFDTETTGLPLKFASPEDPKILPYYNPSRLLQLSWAAYDVDGHLIYVKDHLIKPEGFPVMATEIHGITEEMAKFGDDMVTILREFMTDIKHVEHIVAHNISFDVNILRSEFIRHNQRGLLDLINSKHHICTKNGVKYDKPAGGGRAQRRQCQIYETLFHKKMKGAHNSKFDTLNLGRIVAELRKRGKLVF